MREIKPPFNPDRVFQQAIAHHQTGKFAEAEGLYKKLLSYYPNQVEVLTHLGILLLQHGRMDEGVVNLKKSLGIAPRQPEVYYNLGVAYQAQPNLEEALACYRQALSFNPNDINILINCGNTLKDLKRCDEALACFDRAISAGPQYAPVYWNKALLKLLMGDYAEGWRLYEWGIQSGERGKPREFSKPRWLGAETLKGKTLLIYAEQGLGDLIQFCRYALMAEAQGAKVILEVPDPLVSLMSTLSENVLVVEKGQPLPEHDLVCSVMSLPFAFKTTLQTVPAPVPYLSTNQLKQQEWRQRLGPKTRPRVGLVWSGGMGNKIDQNPCARRNIPLEQLKTLFELPIEFHCLQKEIRPEDGEALSSLDIQTHHEQLNDFSDTAALIGEMDLVISVCTSVAHLAGALGHPTWILLPTSPDYRWMLERDNSPWYPSVILFRQKKVLDWTDVLADVAEKLRNRFHF